MSRSPSTLLAPLLVVCLLAPESHAQASQSRPSSRATSRAAKPASIAEATGDKEAVHLAKKVVAYAGGKGAWSTVKNLVFTFGGRRRLYWDRVSGKVRIETVTGPGRRPGRGAATGTSVYDFKTKKAVKLTGRASRSGTLAESCRRAWINDSYWLLLNLKVMDPGVKLALLPAEENDSKEMSRLRLRFAKGIGITSQNQYVLHVEKKTGKVLRWDFHATEDTPARMSNRFEQYQKVGPLFLSLDRPMLGRRGSLALTGVAVNVKAPDDIWTSTEDLLEKLGRPQQKRKK